MIAGFEGVGCLGVCAESIDRGLEIVVYGQIAERVAKGETFICSKGEGSPLHFSVHRVIEWPELVEGVIDAGGSCKGGIGGLTRNSGVYIDDFKVIGGGCDEGGHIIEILVVVPYLCVNIDILLDHNEGNKTDDDGNSAYNWHFFDCSDEIFLFFLLLDNGGVENILDTFWLLFGGLVFLSLNYLFIR